MSNSSTRARLRRKLGAHLTQLGYSSTRPGGTLTPEPEIVRVNPVRGSIAYGETVLRTDLRCPQRHERLVSLSQRRTRHRKTILLFIAVADTDAEDLEALLERLAIRDGIRGGHVQIVTIGGPKKTPRRTAPQRLENE